MTTKNNDIITQAAAALSKYLLHMENAKGYVNARYGKNAQVNLDGGSLVARIHVHSEELVNSVKGTILPIIRANVNDPSGLYVSNAVERIMETTDEYSVEVLMRRVGTLPVNGPGGIAAHFEQWFGTIYTRIQSLVQIIMEWLDKHVRLKKST